MRDCRNLATTYGAEHWQVGCLFERESKPDAPKFSYGAPGPVMLTSGVEQRPAVNCGW
jgi:hypothetical protein